ncbi:MAG: DUF4190 domain-containing protein, partial [Phycisphaerales bacterium]|nr:DUF4190 domain-containing protein [Phycisphaerales bacterium]
MSAPDEHIDSPFDDHIERDPLGGGRGSHEGHAAHGGKRVPTAQAMGYAPKAPYSNVPLCTFCGYELTGMDVGGNCPECGKPIWESNIQSPTSGLSIASMVCGIVGLVSCVLYGFPTIILGPLAIIFGEISIRQYKRGERAGSTKGFSLTGRICGWIGTVLVLGFWGVILA